MIIHCMAHTGQLRQRWRLLSTHELYISNIATDKWLITGSIVRNRASSVWYENKCLRLGTYIHLMGVHTPGSVSLTI